MDKLKQYLYNIPEIYNSPHNGILLKENKEIVEVDGIKEKEEDKKVKLGNKNINSKIFNFKIKLINKKIFKEEPFDNLNNNSF